MISKPNLLQPNWKTRVIYFSFSIYFGIASLTKNNMELDLKIGKAADKDRKMKLVFQRDMCRRTQKSKTCEMLIHLIWGL